MADDLPLRACVAFGEWLSPHVIRLLGKLTSFRRLKSGVGLLLPVRLGT